MLDNNTPREGSNTSTKPALSAAQQEEAEQLRERLAIYRRTLHHYLVQEASLGEAYTPPAILNGIYETREQIRQLKGDLAKWGILVENSPDDEERSTSPQKALVGNQVSRSLVLPSIISAGIVACMVLVGLFLFNQQRSSQTQNAVAVLPIATPIPPTTAPTAVPAPTEIPPVAQVAQGNYMVLVSQFAFRRDGQEDTTQAVVQNLKKVFEQERREAKLQVRFYPGVTTSDEQALQVADKNKAAVVVRGSVGADSTGVDIQVGSLLPFPNSKISRDIIERTVNIHVEMTSTEKLSIAPQVVVVLQAIQTSEGEGTAVVRNADTIDQMVNGLKLVSPPIDDNNVAAHFHRGLLKHFSDASKAVEEYNAAITQTSTNPLLYLLRATALSRLGQFGQAAKDITTATILEPTHTWTAPIYMQMLADLYNSDYAGGLQAADRIVQQQPQDWLPVFARGSFHYFLQDYQDAQADLVRAIKLNPESSLPYQQLALVYLHQGKIANAQQQLAAAQQKFPDPDNSRRLLYGLFGNQPNIYSALFDSFNKLSFGRFDETIAATQQASQAYTNNADFPMLQGLAYCRSNDYANAEASYSQAIKRDPSYTVVRLLRAEARLRQQNNAGAVDDVTFIQHDPNAAAFAPYLEAFQNTSPTNQTKSMCETFFSP